MAISGLAHTHTAKQRIMNAKPALVQNRAYINGQWQDALDGSTFEVLNPATSDLITEVPDMNVQDADRAVDAAAAALAGWGGTSPASRAKILVRWADLIQENAEDLAFLMTLEQGKPLAESRGEVLAAAETVRWCAEEGRRLYGEFIDGAKAGTKIVISRQPVGVVGAITPWNFPVGMITRKVGPALAAGCTVVLKPAEATPLCALALAKLSAEAGLPQGVLNIITSAKAAEIGQKFTTDTRVRKISFTGSTAVGKKLMAQASAHVQKISLELGGNAPFIVFPSADLERAADGAIASKFRNAGQTCICANRIFVHRDIYEVFLKLFSKKIKELSVGDGCQDGVTIGPLINIKAVEKIEKMIDLAVRDGAKIELGGKRHALGGSFFEPTLITGVRDNALMACEEIFGPVAALYIYDNEDEVVRRANDTPYGLAAYLYTNDQKQAWRVSDRLEYGMVGVNEPLLASDLAPFGGIKESGIGREGGQYGLLEYTDVKYRLLG